VAGRLGFEPR